MPTNRRKSARRRDMTISDSLRRYLDGDPTAPKHDIDLQFFTSDEEIKAVWDLHKAEILEQWIKDRPGTRPVCWWRYDAPAEHDGPIKYSMRKQVSGPPCDFSGILPARVCGLPIHLNLGKWHMSGVVMLSPIDEIRDDVYFESEATYLKRHNLLTPEETARLTEADFEPVRWTSEHKPVRYKPDIETR